MMGKLMANNWGRLMVEKLLKPYEGEGWGLDNGAYGAHLRGERFDMDAFRAKVDKAVEIPGCEMGVLPDIVAGGEESLDYSMGELEKLPSLPWYLVVQDGMELQPLWGRVVEAAKDPRIIGLFLGGTSRFKLTAGSWRHVADMVGKKLHYGRCGTPFKVQHAIRVGVDSLDSSFPLWTYERFGIFEQAINGTLEQMPLDLDLGGPPAQAFMVNEERTEK
jgi:hypothetical protein